MADHVSLFDTLSKWSAVLSPAVALLVNNWVQDYKRKRYLKRNNNMETSFSRKKKVQPILDEILYRMKSTRVIESAFSNGEVTFNGYHLKKVSVTAESHQDNLKDIGMHFQLVPAKKYERNLDALYESKNEYIITNEELAQDELGDLCRAFDFNSMLLIQIKDDQDRWVGLLSIIYDGITQISDEDIAYCKMAASRIGCIK